MPRYIDVDALVKAWDRECENATDLFDAFDYAVEDTPTADVEEVKHGEWDASGRYKFADDSLAIRCTECGCALHESELEQYHWNYCPNCGAKMDGKGDSK